MRTKQMNPNDMDKIQNPAAAAAEMPQAPDQMQPAPMSPEDEAEAKEHLGTLMDAEMVKQDPAKMAKVHALAGRHAKAITSVQGLKDAHNAKFGGKMAQPMPPQIASMGFAL